MSLSCTTLRLITLLFLLAGILLLKPVFGQTNVTPPQIRVSTLGEDATGQYNRVYGYLAHIELASKR